MAVTLVVCVYFNVYKCIPVGFGCSCVLRRLLAKPLVQVGPLVSVRNLRCVVHLKRSNRVDTVLLRKSKRRECRNMYTKQLDVSANYLLGLFTTPDQNALGAHIMCTSTCVYVEPVIFFNIPCSHSQSRVFLLYMQYNICISMYGSVRIEWDDQQTHTNIVKASVSFTPAPCPLQQCNPNKSCKGETSVEAEFTRNTECKISKTQPRTRQEQRGSCTLEDSYIPRLLLCG